MAKRKIIKNEVVEQVNEIEKVDVISNNEEIDDIIVDEVIDEEPFKVVENNDIIEVKQEEVKVNNVEVKEKIIKKPLLFGYIWNGQEYD